MPSRNVMTKQTALARARERRRELDRERGEHDARVEAATATALLALEIRADAVNALNLTQTRVAEALRLMLAEDVSVERAAALLELEVSEVRRLTRAERSPAARGPTAAPSE